MPELSEVLNVSINELLNGELSPKENTAKVSEAPLVYVCNNAAQSKRRSRKKIIWLSIGLGVAGLFALLCLLYIIFSAVSIIGSVDPQCVIADDYSYIIYQNEKYLPVDTKGYTFCDKDELVDEATVEGQSILGKLLFGDSVCSVAGTENNSVIHLETDFDYAPSEYYAKETELENIENCIENFEEKNIYTMDIPYYLFSVNELENTSVLAEGEFWEMLFGLPDSVNPDTSFYADGITYYNSISVVASDENSLIYKAKGEIIRHNGKYYWVECEGNSFDENYQPYLKHPYPIDSEYYGTIESLFLATNDQ